MTYENWLEGVRRGRTFVTIGPMLEFRVEGKGMGEEVVLEQAGSVEVQGRVRFDPTWDDVERLEVIENGLVLRSFPRTGNSPEIRFQFEHHVPEASWLAIRAYGKKLGEAEPRRRPSGVIHALSGPRRKPIPPPFMSRWTVPLPFRPIRAQRPWLAHGWPGWRTWNPAWLWTKTETWPWNGRCLQDAPWKRGCFGGTVPHFSKKSRRHATISLV